MKGAMVRGAPLDTFPTAMGESMTIWGFVSFKSMETHVCSCLGDFVPSQLMGYETLDGVCHLTRI